MLKTLQLAVLLSLVLVGMPLHQLPAADGTTMVPTTEQENVYLYTFDVIEAVRASLKTRFLKTDGDLTTVLKSLYDAKLEVDSALVSIQRWNDSSTLIESTNKRLEEGLTELREGIDLLITLTADQSAHPDADTALMLSKGEAGRRKILEGVKELSALINKGGYHGQTQEVLYFSLTKEQRESIAKFAEVTIEREIFLSGPSKTHYSEIKALQILVTAAKADPKEKTEDSA